MSMKISSVMQRIGWYVGIALCCAMPHISSAATLGMSPSVLSLHVGETATVRVYVSSTDVTVNAAEANVLYPSDILEVMGVSKSASIFSIWLDEPTYSNSTGIVSFSGGLPTPGYQGGMGNVVSIVFKAVHVGTATLQLSDASVRADDGLGSDILKGSSGAVITVAPALSSPTATPTSPVEPSEPKTTATKHAATTEAPPAVIATTSVATTTFPLTVSTPTFIFEPDHPAENGLITIRGTAGPGTQRVEVHIVGETMHKVISIVPDADGSYELDTAELQHGEYTVWAEAVNNTIHSRPTQGMYIVVSSPVIGSLAGFDITLYEALWVLLIIACAGLVLGSRATYHIWKHKRLHSRLRDITHLEKEIIAHSSQLRTDLEKFAEMFEYTHRYRNLSKAEQSMYRSISALIRQLNATTTQTEDALERTEKEE